MANFPTGFTEIPHDLQVSEVEPEFAKPLQELWDRGFVVVAGLRRCDVPDLTNIARQPDVREFCPNDFVQRWTNAVAAERQLGNNGGRAVFRLEDRHTSETAAFGWTGKAANEESAITDAEHTFAIRIRDYFQREGLARPFTLAIIGGSMALFGAKQIGLETWKSNPSAVATYRRAGAVLACAVNDTRPTLDESYPIANSGKHAGKHTRPDTRLYMRFPQTF